MGLTIHQMDMKTAFLNGVLNSPIYVGQPKNFNQKGNGYVWRLKKALYGLVEAPRLWYETPHHCLADFGFRRALGDPGLYVLRRGSHIVARRHQAAHSAHLFHGRLAAGRECHSR
ncbi:hypothetical protein PBRA_004607 [Plasmodiophora brassicae]|uniref:Reverse transcriptase Ty1/copia-type domain-containing protein n=1 Tax=Plasmodiophora brassicae TaxID=37360 RepID=A0A0G4ILD9_PLABS|nr:hypothetical protein PBRA_004607 [Plasmodiophora brassicae]